MNDPLRSHCARVSGSFRRRLNTGAAGLMVLAVLRSGSAPAEADPLDVSPWLSQQVQATKRGIDPLIDYRVFPWPYAYAHNIERTDRFTNISDDTSLSITGVTALGLDPQDLGIVDLTADNAAAAEQAAFAAHGDFPLWDSEDWPLSAARSLWSTSPVRAVDAQGAPLSFPLSVEPRESIWLVSKATSIGNVADFGELLLGWQFQGTTSVWSPPRMGDINADGRVDIADFAVLKANLGAPGANWFQGDLDGDGRITLGDFGLFKQAFGTAAAAPEPTSAVLALAGLLALACGWRRRRRSCFIAA